MAFGVFGEGAVYTKKTEEDERVFQSEGEIYSAIFLLVLYQDCRRKLKKDALLHRYCLISSLYFMP